MSFRLSKLPEVDGTGYLITSSLNQLKQVNNKQKFSNIPEQGLKDGQENRYNTKVCRYVSTFCMKFNNLTKLVSDKNSEWNYSLFGKFNMYNK